MANEIRIRSNNQSGTILDAPLLVAATSIQSAGFVDLPVIDGTNHLILVLDPLEVGGPAEIVTVTAHTSASDTVTVIRAQEGSSARQHALGTTWFHGPVVSDFENQSWGQLGYVQNTSGDQAFSGTTETLLTGLSVVAVPGTGRRIRVTVKGQYFASALDAVASVKTRIKEDAVNIAGGAYDITQLTNQGTNSYQFSVIYEPTPGSHTYTVSGQRINGTATISHRANTVENSYLLVEDIGAA